MGTPLPPIFIEPGDDCPTCFGDGKTFDDPTPAKIYLELHDWSEGQFFVEGFRGQLESVQVLDQIGGFPCLWASLTANFIWTVQYNVGNTTITVSENPPLGHGTFSGTDLAICLKTLDNAVAGFAGNNIFGGYASFVFGTPV